MAMTCDSAGRPKELAAVCRERDELQRRVAQLERDLDAAVAFIRKSCEGCEMCANVGIMDRLECGGLCFECQLEKNCVCGTCRGGSNFQLRRASDA